MDVLLRTAQPEDAPALSRVATVTFLEGWADIIGEESAAAYAGVHLDPESLQAEIASPREHHFLLATIPDTRTIVGYAKLGLTRPPHASVIGPAPVVLQRFYVAAEGRGHGVADTLLVESEQAAKAFGFRTIWLECDPRNARAWRYYEKRGFLPRGNATYHYPDGCNDKIRILERAIVQDIGL